MPMNDAAADDGNSEKEKDMVTQINETKNEREGIDHENLSSNYKHFLPNSPFMSNGLRCFPFGQLVTMPSWF